METVEPSLLVWTEEEFLRVFSISRETLLAWVEDGLPALRCPDDSFRIPAVAVNAFLLGREVDTPYLTVEDAASYCRVAVQTIYNNRRHIQRMPGIRKLLFTREALDRWLSTRRKPSRRLG